MAERIVELDAGTYDIRGDSTSTATVPALTAGSIAEATPSIGNTLTVTGSNVSGGATTAYQWQQSADGSTGWTNISGATSATLDTSSGVTDDYYVRRGVEDGAQSMVYTSGVQVDAASTFDPASLFGSGEDGILHVFSDTANLRQESDGSGSAPVADDPIGYAADLSGNGGHSTQTNASLRPTLRSDGTGFYLEYDGSNDSLIINNNQISGSQNRTLIVVGDKLCFTLGSQAAGDGERWTVLDDPSGTGDLRIEVNQAYTSDLSTGDLAVYGCVLDGTTLGDHTLHKNNATESAAGAVAVNTTSAFNLIGVRNGVAYRASNLRFLLFIDRVLTSGEMSDLKSHLYSEYGITP